MSRHYRFTKLFGFDREKEKWIRVQESTDGDVSIDQAVFKLISDFILNSFYWQQTPNVWSDEVEQGNAQIDICMMKIMNMLLWYPSLGLPQALPLLLSNQQSNRSHLLFVIFIVIGSRREQLCLLLLAATFFWQQQQQHKNSITLFWPTVAPLDTWDPHPYFGFTSRAATLSCLLQRHRKYQST